MTGLYGLELRTVTAALNASILPTALRAAEPWSRRRRRRAAADVPLLVMRGDGGSAGMEAMRTTARS